MYLDDCLEGSLRITQSDCPEPLNLGSDEVVTINHLVSLLEDFAGMRLRRNYVIDAPQGVRGRNSDNSKTKSSAYVRHTHAASSCNQR